MSMTVVGSDIGSGSSVSSVACDNPAGLAVGDLMTLVCIRYYYTDAPTVIPGTAFYRYGDPIATATSQNYVDFIGVWQKVADQSDIDTYTSVTLNWSNSHKTKAVLIVHRGGFDVSDPLDTFSNDNYITENTTLRAGSVTPSADASPALFIGGVYITSSITASAPSGFTQDFQNHDTSTDQLLCVHQGELDASASGDIDATLSNSSNDKHAFILVMNPDSGDNPIIPALMGGF